MSPLAKAIKLRIWTRRALEADDAAGDEHLTALRGVISEAEEAVRVLSPKEMSGYMKWCRENP